MAEYLLARGPEINWIGHGGMTPLDAARRDDAERLVGQIVAEDLVGWLRAHGAKSAEELG